MDFFAHSVNGAALEEWQKLEVHLENVSELAGEFARHFGAQDWGRLAGYVHDLGKGTFAWQAYLRRVNGIVDEFNRFYEGHPQHSVVGAQWLYKQSKDVGKLLAYCVAGHHGGLPNWDDSPHAALASRLMEPSQNVELPMSALDISCALPLLLEKERLGFQFQFFARMLFSCLVDADFLDTETFLDQEKSKKRSSYKLISEIQNIFWRRFERLRRLADKNLPVNQHRETVLSACINAAEKPVGIFSLTVPTGGGKTLASLAFALNHALRHDQRRVIYVIPFTSIIEQNAKVFREFLGDGAVLEHHCNFNFETSDWQGRLAAENWDAPIIVTTNVQFFDSFFSRKPSRCRKLHRIANSVVIFDEVQAIPVEKLEPCLEVIKELSANYGVTSVLCTATQPALHYSADFRSGLKNVSEIIEDVPKLFSSLKRTEEHFEGVLSAGEIAEKLEQHRQVLCIVNTRQQALDIFEKLPESQENKHLSALMYPRHRTEVLDDILARLKPENNLPCRVVSTQLIEAGVDVDFPCVYRTISGIDSIAQAAGRCNREGKNSEPGEVKVFDLTGGGGASFMRKAVQSATKLMTKYDGNLTSPKCVQEYFSDYFWKNEQRMDEDGVLEFCRNAHEGDIQFRDIAKFQMIRTDTIPIIVVLDEYAQELVETLTYAEHRSGILRRLQQYSVQVYPWQFEEIKEWLEMVVPEVWALRSEHLYSRRIGLKCAAPSGEAFFG